MPKSDPRCPDCGSPTFIANVDDVDTVFCTNNECKWKAPVSNETGLLRDSFR